MIEPPLVAVRAAERHAAERIARAEVEADEIVGQARAESRLLLDQARAALDPEREKLRTASLAEAEAAAALIRPTETGEAEGLVDRMMSAVLPEEA